MNETQLSEALDNREQNPNNFKNLIKENYDLRKTAKLFPQHAEALIKIIHQDKDEFKRLIEIDYDLRETAKLFPQHAEIFGKPSVSEAVKANKYFQSFTEIRKNARVLAQSYRTNTGPAFFKNLSPEMLVKIAAHTGNRELHDEKQSETIAYKNFDRPPKETVNLFV